LKPILDISLSLIAIPFLYIDPLKQGLKLVEYFSTKGIEAGFYT